MKRTLSIISVFALLSMAQSAFAQSVSSAKSLIEQGSYLEAAKQLRPLADGGNAEAQYLAATLFFEGKGVNKNAQQGVKYATLAADQGNISAVILLMKMANDDVKALRILSSYCERFPEMKKSQLGLVLAKCYLTGTGVEKDLKKGIAIYEQNEHFESLMADTKEATLYWESCTQMAGKDCLEDYADHLYRTKDDSRYNLLRTFIIDVLYKDGKHGTLAEKAEQGNGWAMAEVANRLLSQGKADALSWARKAMNAGSAYGRFVYNKIAYVPSTYNIVRTTSSTTTSTDVLKLEQGFDYTTIYFCYHQRGFNDWVATGQDTYLMLNGKRYKLLRTTLPMLPKRRKVALGEAVNYTWTFERIPDSATEFTIYENGDRYGFKITK